MSSVPNRPIVRAVVLAAGAGRRFGGVKLGAELEGRAILEHVLDRLAAAGFSVPIVVVPPDGRLAESLSGARAARAGMAGVAATVVNPEPERGLSSSLQVGWAEALASEPTPAAVLVVLGDQPRVAVELLQRLAAAPVDADRPIVAPRYRGGGGSNPVRIETSAASLVEATSGDRGLGPLLDRQPELVRWLDVQGTNPDVDTREDLAALQATTSGEP